MRLTVAEVLTDNRVKILVAVAYIDNMVKGESGTSSDETSGLVGTGFSLKFFIFFFRM
jgi:N-acetyl-gamma-glutamylphosphate reductase